jgi:N-methylhydantoinase B
VLEDCRLSIISERRAQAPQGERGGAPGALGANLVNGEPAGAKLTRDLHSGDVVTIETPGGGGWGS